MPRSEPEPDATLSELLDDPVVRTLMRRDGVDPADVRDLIEALRRRRAPPPDDAGPT